MMTRLAIFASGSGSNAENIYKYFQGNESVQVKYLVCNKPDAGVIAKFENPDVEIILIQKSDLSSAEFHHRIKDVDMIILAGFLLQIPIEFITQFPKIINIHPSLLPKYGGKGMYGEHVHRAVLANHDTETGITIHYVNEEYDKGAIIYQAKVELSHTDDLDCIKSKIHQLEMENFPRVIEKVLAKNGG